MRRDQLEHAIRTACRIIGRPGVIVLGSKSILGNYREEDLPAEATMSVEVDLQTSVLPGRWRERLIKVQNANTAAPSGEPVFTGWCLDKEDLCVAKPCALREKDQNFVAALLDARTSRPRRDHRAARGRSWPAPAGRRACDRLLGSRMR